MKTIYISGETAAGKSTATELLEQFLPNSATFSGDKILFSILDALCLELNWDIEHKIPENLVNNADIKKLSKEKFINLLDNYVLKYINYLDGRDFLNHLIEYSNETKQTFKEAKHFLQKLLPVIDKELQLQLNNSNTEYKIFDWFSANALPSFANDNTIKISIIANGDARAKRIYDKIYHTPIPEWKADIILDVHNENRKKCDRLFSSLPATAPFDITLTSNDKFAYKSELQSLTNKIITNQPLHRPLPPHLIK